MAFLARGASLADTVAALVPLSFLQHAFTAVEDLLLNADVHATVLALAVETQAKF